MKTSKTTQVERPENKWTKYFIFIFLKGTNGQSYVQSLNTKTNSRMKAKNNGGYNGVSSKE